MEKRPVLLITQGDAAGIGPEVTLKALARPEVYEYCLPVVVGDGASLCQTRELLNSPLSLNAVARPEEAPGRYGAVDYIDLGILRGGAWQMGEVSAACGDAAFRYIVKAIELAMAGAADAVVTAPINKEAIRLAGCQFAGHTEIFAHYTHTENYAMVLVAGPLRVIHVTTHVSMREACRLITKERVLRTVRLANEAAALMGGGGKIAVAGLNAHSSEHGLFGSEEEEAIIPAIEAARAEGLDVEGPVAPDTVFVKALAGQYACVAAMYHDQGHIPVKLAGFRMDEKTGEFTAVSGVNCTVGLPIIRTSVDHGTAFDRAGRNLANDESMADALCLAAQMARRRAQGAPFGKV